MNMEDLCTMSDSQLRYIFPACLVTSNGRIRSLHLRARVMVRHKRLKELCSDSSCSDSSSDSSDDEPQLLLHRYQTANVAFGLGQRYETRLNQQACIKAQAPTTLTAGATTLYTTSHMCCIRCVQGTAYGCASRAARDL